VIALPLKHCERILCLGAHSDDIEIGCGGTLLSLIAENPAVEVRWVVFSAQPPRNIEAKRSALEFLAKGRKRTIELKKFRTSFFPYQGQAIKEAFEQIKSKFSPDVIFTHYRDDRHQDHCVLSDLAWNTFRTHLILEYEIIKYDGDLGSPNLFVPLAEEICTQKIDLLLKHFRTQSNKHWFTRSTFEAMHRIRGVECASSTGFAEAFYCRKLVLGLI
jgi:LmbE family N-acetylglucosaminyl deacetylase